MDNAKNHTENNALKNAGKNRKRIGNSAKENAPTEGRGANAKNHTANVNSTSTAAQRARLLSFLRDVGPITTLQARDELNIMHPAGRVMELKKRGHNIVTVWAWDSDHEGRPHRVGRYALLSGESGD